jgi:glycyl-tRNA synthetase
LKLPLLLAKEREHNQQEITQLSVEEALKRGVVTTEWGAYFMALSVQFVESLGIPVEKQRFEEKLPKERSHYSSQTFDHQIWLDRWGWVEIAGHAYRTDYDLSAHIKGSGVDLSIFKPYATTVEKKALIVVPIDSMLGPLLREKAKPVIEALRSTDPTVIKNAFERSGFFEVHGFKVQPAQVRFEERLVRETGRRVVPHVVEPSFGAERIVYSMLEYSYTRNKDRIVLKLPSTLAPTKVIVLPLMAKDGLPEVGALIQRTLVESGIDAEYDEGGMIGRRYARADEIGVPLSITVDYQTKTDGTVTIRDRDTWQQVRREWKELPQLIDRFLKKEASFEELGTPVQVAYD